MESDSVKSGTEVLIENVCIKRHALQTYCIFTFAKNVNWTLVK